VDRAYITPEQVGRDVMKLKWELEKKDFKYLLGRAMGERNISLRAITTDGKEVEAESVIIIAEMEASGFSPLKPPKRALESSEFG
jgi:hypothetical protein